MRRRYFLLVFAILIATIVVVGSLQFFFFENERMRLIDQRLETIASSLLASGLSMDLIHNLESTDDLISDLIGEERVDQIINIYSDRGEVLARNFTATELPLQFSTERFQTYEVEERNIRVLNLRSGSLVIQVGVVLAPSLLNRWRLINRRSALFSAGILALLAISAYFGSYMIFAPIRKLTKELKSMSAQLERKMGQPLSEFVIGPELKRLTEAGQATRDEFNLLLDEIRNFLRRLGEYTRNFHGQTAILTHELKTPLTVLRNYLSDLKNAKDLSEANHLGEEAVREIDELSRLINGYLQWSVLSSNPGRVAEIHAVRLNEAAKKTVSDLNRSHADRIQLTVEGDGKVFALPDHVQQLLSNLLSNALNYSSGPVYCRVESARLTVSDQGAGIPEVVLKHLGSPFNRGGRGGSGLGLAWVKSLCEKYDWALDINSSSHGTTIRVSFPV